jgi:hypothetical protein
MKFVKILLVAILLTSSCEIILTFDIGAKLHIAQIFLAFLCAAALLICVYRRSLLWTRECTAITIWAAAMVILVPIAGNMMLSIAFTGMMLLMVGSYIAMLQLFGNGKHFEWVMRWYLLSYVILAGIGLVQFTLPLIGLPSFDVMQWWIHGRLARINGFTYEPSFYATYMIMGWVTLLELRHSRSPIVAHPRWKYATILLTVVLILSSSRTAIVMMIVEGTLRVFGAVWPPVRRSMGYLAQGRLVFPLMPRLVVARLLMALATFGLGAWIVAANVDPLIFLAGTGLGNTATHSVDGRESDFRDTLLVATQHPWIGRGVGGVSIANGKNKGRDITTFEDARLYEGFSVFLTTYAESGFFVFIPFALFCWYTSFGAMIESFRAARAGNVYAQSTYALARATLIVYIALCVDQNLFRTYVWVHLGMGAVAAFHFRHARRAEGHVPQGMTGLTAAPSVSMLTQHVISSI